MKKDTINEDYWFINNKAYDLTKFEHPGGPVALGLGRGRDATQLFYSYHPFSLNKAEAILRKYEVKSIPEDQVAHTKLFDWHTKSDFFEQLRREVKKALPKDVKAPFERWVQIGIMAVVSIIFSYYYILGHWWALIAAPLSMWVLGVNTFHDASHFALSNDWRINAFFTYPFPWFSSPFTWYHQHVIGHHCYTNVHKEDPDLHHSARLWRYTRRSRWFSHYKWQCYYLFLVWMMITTSLAFIIDALFFLKGSYHGVVKMMRITRTRFWAHVLGRLIALVVVFLWPYFVYESMWKAYIWSVVPNMIFGLSFSLSSQLSHLTNENIDEFSSEWHKHQVMTSHTFCPDSLFWFFFTGGLSLQIEHHLFPGVNHWHLRTIQPIVQRVCQEHGINYTMSSTMTEAFQKHMTLLDELSHK